MPIYEYTAIDTSGRSKRGIITADSLPAARAQLKGKGLYPSAINESSKRAKMGGGSLSDRFHQLNATLVSLTQRVGQGELAAATRQIATMLAAGLPLTTSIGGVMEQSKGTALYKVLAQVQERVNEGSSLAIALEEHPRVFSTTYVSMIRAGENSGTLEMVLEQLADFAEQQVELKRKVQSTMAYPILMLLVGVGVILFLMAYVIPKVTQIFVSMKKGLPLVTEILITFSEIVRDWWFVMPIVAVLCWGVLKWILRTEKGKVKVHSFILKLPLVGPVVHRLAIARFSRTLGTLLKNGVPMLRALDIVRTVSGNVIMTQAIDDVRKEISEGEGLTRPLSRRKIFPPTVIQMMAAGEQSGNLDDMLLRIAGMSENEVSARLTVMTSLMEPLMILFLGGVVGFVVLAVMLPIFEMSSLVQ